MSTTDVSDGRETLLLSEPEAAQQLRITPRTLYALRRSGEMPHLKIGTRVLYRRSDVEAFCAKRLTGETASTAAVASSTSTSRPPGIAATERSLAAAGLL